MADEAIRLSPSMTKAVYRRGLAYAELGMFRRAIEDLRRVLKVVPGDFEATKRLDECERELRSILFASAIKKEEFNLDRESIDKIEVESTYSGPRIVDGHIDMEFVKSLVKHFKQERKLHPRFAYEIMLQAKALLAKECNLVDISVDEGQQLTICGDIHGQFFDLVKIFDINGYPSKDHYYVQCLCPSNLSSSMAILWIAVHTLLRLFSHCWH